MTAPFTPAAIAARQEDLRAMAPTTPNHAGYEQDTYLNLADEASADDFDRADFDEEAMAAADAFARRHRLPLFDEVADIDKALVLVNEEEDMGRFDSIEGVTPPRETGEHVPLQHDSMGMGYIVYPGASDTGHVLDEEGQ